MWQCSPYKPRALVHPRGGLIQYKRGDYPNHRRGQTLGVEEYGTSVVCAHPDCLELFLAANRSHEYCDTHKNRREEVRRLRRVRPPKRERFAFILAAGVDELTYHWGPLAEETKVRPGETRFAGDEEEFLELVQLAAPRHFGSPSLTVTDTLA